MSDLIEKYKMFGSFYIYIIILTIFDNLKVEQWFKS